MTSLRRPCVYAVSSRQRVAPTARTTSAEIQALHSWIEAVIAAGVDVLQIRERDLGAGQLRDVVGAAVRLAQGSSTVVLVNDRADVALAAGAGGVHLPSAGLPVSAARRVSTAWTVGRSIHDGEDPGAMSGADYVLFGTVFPSRSKGDPGHRPAGLDALGAAVQRAACPVVAIGGISPERAKSCIDRGAAGVAAIGLFLPAGTEPGALGAGEATRRLRDAFLH